MSYCQVIVDIAHEDVDRVFTYRVPRGMALCPGMRVHVPFGRIHRMEGIVVEMVESCDLPPERVKDVTDTLEDYPAVLPHLSIDTMTAEQQAVDAVLYGGFGIVPVRQILQADAGFTGLVVGAGENAVAVKCSEGSGNIGREGQQLPVFRQGWIAGEIDAPADSGAAAQMIFTRQQPECFAQSGAADVEPARQGGFARQHHSRGEGVVPDLFEQNIVNFQIVRRHEQLPLSLKIIRGRRSGKPTITFLCGFPAGRSK